MRFLLKDLSIPSASIRFALRHCEQTPTFFPLILWQYGLVSLQQLEQIWDWLDMGEIPYY